MKDHPLQHPPLLIPAIQTPFLENHFIKNQHRIPTTASSHNTPSNLHQSFCCGKLDELRETAQKCNYRREKARFLFPHVCILGVLRFINNGWMVGSRRTGGEMGGGDFLHSFPATGGPGHTRLARHVPQLPPCVRQDERRREGERGRVGGREARGKSRKLGLSV